MILAGSALLTGARAQTAPSANQFVGTTPCGEAVRAFLGGMDRAAACHAVRWNLTFDTPGTDATPWSATAVYGVPPSGNPNQMIDGPKVSVRGVYRRTAGGRGSIKAAYQLVIDGSGRSMTFAQLGDDLLHELAVDGTLAIGTAGWSYTLNRADRAEPQGNPSAAPDMSYTISPRATGTDVFGVFEGRTACAGIARELRITPTAGCLKVKWRVTLLWNAGSTQPTTYKVESSLHRSAARTGAWQLVRGATTDADATVFQLNATPSEAPMLLLKGSEDVLFVLDHARRLLVGNVDFGYTLNRVRP